MANDQDVLTFAYGSFFVMLFVSAILTLALGGSLVWTYEKADSLYLSISEDYGAKAEENGMGTSWSASIKKSTPDNVFWDLVGGVVNVAEFVYKIIAFFISIVINAFTISFWLSRGKTPSAIASLVIFCWQFWTFYIIAKFGLKDRIKGGLSQ